MLGSCEKRWMCWANVSPLVPMTWRTGVPAGRTGHWLMGTGYRVLAYGLWVGAHDVAHRRACGTGLWVVGTGHWLVGLEYWLVGCGSRVLAYGSRVMTCGSRV